MGFWRDFSVPQGLYKRTKKGDEEPWAGEGKNGERERWNNKQPSLNAPFLCVFFPALATLDFSPLAPPRTSQWQRPLPPTSSLQEAFGGDVDNVASILFNLQAGTRLMASIRADKDFPPDPASSVCRDGMPEELGPHWKRNNFHLGPGSYPVQAPRLCVLPTLRRVESSCGV